LGRYCIPSKLGKGEESLSSYFKLNWFNIAPKWTTLGRRHLPTFGNNTTNPLEKSKFKQKKIKLKNIIVLFTQVPPYHQGNISKNKEIRSSNTPSSRQHQVTDDGEKIEAKN
jgi:hypothetical protein